MTKKRKKITKSREKTVKLTLKQRKWLLEYMEDGNQTRAALIAYYPSFPMPYEYSNLTDEQKKIHRKASVIGFENLRKLSIPIEHLLDEAGLTDVYFIQKLKENMNATRLYGPMAVEGMDGSARNQAWENGMKLKGKLITKIDHTTMGKEMRVATVVDLGNINKKKKK